MSRPRPKLAVHKLASCDGCQLTLLDCEDELLALAELVNIANFPEASSRIEPGPYDLVLVEGSITSAHDRERIHRIRAEARFLVTIGACATSGGIQALRNFRDHDAMLRAVYARPEYLDSLSTSTPVSDHVRVDFELRGCPIDKRQLLDVVASFLAGKRPSVRAHSTCLDCKKKGNVCVMVVSGTPCLGPVTHAGCDALCPTYDRGCFGCFGPADAAQVVPLGRRLREYGASAGEVARLFHGFTAWSQPFRDEGDAHGD